MFLSSQLAFGRKSAPVSNPWTLPVSEIRGPEAQPVQENNGGDYEGPSSREKETRTKSHSLLVRTAELESEFVKQYFVSNSLWMPRIWATCAENTPSRFSLRPRSPGLFLTSYRIAVDPTTYFCFCLLHKTSGAQAVWLCDRTVTPRPASQWGSSSVVWS